MKAIAAGLVLCGVIFVALLRLPPDVLTWVAGFAFGALFAVPASILGVYSMSQEAHTTPQPHVTVLPPQRAQLDTGQPTIKRVSVTVHRLPRRERERQALPSVESVEVPAMKY